MDENRLIEIETKLAHQEQLLGDLNAALSSQQSQLTRLELLCESLVARIRSMPDGDMLSDRGNQRPPHY